MIDGIWERKSLHDTTTVRLEYGGGRGGFRPNRHTIFIYIFKFLLFLFVFWFCFELSQSPPCVVAFFCVSSCSSPKSRVFLRVCCVTVGV